MDDALVLPVLVECYLEEADAVEAELREKLGQQGTWRFPPTPDETLNATLRETLDATLRETLDEQVQQEEDDDEEKGGEGE